MEDLTKINPNKALGQLQKASRSISADAATHEYLGACVQSVANALKKLEELEKLKEGENNDKNS